MRRQGRFRQVALGLLAVGFASLSLSACGAKQSGSGSCPKIKEGISSGGWEQWAACANEGRIQDANVCRSALVYAQGMTPTAMEAATRCVLQAQSRDDGSLIGETLQRVATNRTSVAALARGLAPHYSHDVHGGRFASVVGESGERALGQQLEQIPAPTREELIRTAFAWGLRHLAQAGLGYIEDPSVYREEMETIARRAETSTSLSEVDRYTMVLTGRWGANQILDCHEGKNQACSDGPSAETLRLLEHDRSASRSSVAAARVTGALGTLAADNRSVEIVLDWLSDPSTPNSSSMLDSLRNSVASTSASSEFRRTVAEGANAALCDSRSFPRAAQYAVSSSRTPTNEWATFLSRCIDNFWRAEDFARVLATGYEINASEAQRAKIRSSLFSDLQSGTCGEVEALGTLVSTNHPARNAKEGIIWAEFSDLRRDCAAGFSGKLKQVAGNSEAHPEARLAAIAALAKNGDKSLCGQRSAAERWNADRTGIPVGRGVAVRLQEANNACR